MLTEILILQVNHAVHETNCTAMNIKQEAEEKDPPEYPVSTMLTVYDDDQMVDEEQQAEVSFWCFINVKIV